MKMRCTFAFVAAMAAFGTTLGDETPEAVSGNLVFALDTRQSPRFVKTAEELSEITGGALKVGWGVGEEVTVKSPNGSVTSVSDGTAAGSTTLAVNAGGCWTLVNSHAGTAEIMVRHSLYGTVGGGTMASPAKLVDEDELVDYSAGDGYVFTFVGTDEDAFIAALKLPAGFKLEDAGNEKWRIVSAPDGCLYSWGDRSFPIDSVQDGPDRRTLKREELPIAYSGDNWLGVDATAASTVTFIPPEGDATTLNPTGTGATRFTFDKPGTWTVRLTMADNTTRESILGVIARGFTISFR